MLTPLTFGDFTNDGNNEMSLKIEKTKAALIVMDSRRMSRSDGDCFVVAVKGPQKEVYEEYKKYKDNPRYLVTFIPAEEEEFDYESLSDEEKARLMRNYVEQTSDMRSCYDLHIGENDETRGQLMFLYLLLKCDKFFSPELSVVNKAPTGHRPGYVFPSDFHALEYGGDQPIGSFTLLWKKYKHNRSGVFFVSDYIESEDHLVRFSIVIMEKEETKGESYICLNIYGEKDEETRAQYADKIIEAAKDHLDLRSGYLKKR